MNHRGTDFVKRIADIAVSGSLLIITWPLQLGVGLLVRARLGRPVLFRQARPGRHGTLFTLIKFRTMNSVNERAGLTSDAERLTSLGRALRRSSLDELPTLWNVLKGDMSLVGPRPLLPEYLDRYSPEQARRHEVRPGVTGLAQVSGRNAVDWAERLAMDVQYVDQRSLALDLQVLWRTVRTVLGTEGVAAEGHATMPLFTGHADPILDAE